MPKKPHKRASPKQRDPSWRMRRALGHKVEPIPRLTLVSASIPKMMTPRGPPPDFHCAGPSDLLGIDPRLFIDIVYKNTMD